MNKTTVFVSLGVLLAAVPTGSAAGKTQLTIVGEDFHINGRPTYEGRMWKGHRIEGLLLNSRMVQATYDDLNPETAKRWAYPDTGVWDAERNVREFIAAMPEWKAHGLLAVTVNFQGGSPEGYSGKQPWQSSGFDEDGALRPAFAARMKRVLDAADDLGMAVIVGYFYFGQDQLLRDEAAVLRATDEATRWLLEGGWRHVIVEVNNETNIKAYDHAILRPDRVHELIERVRKTTHDGRRLLVGTSYGGGSVPQANVVRVSDVLLIHGNGVKDPARITEMVKKTRAVPGYQPMPILFNEDDHENFDQPLNNFSAALAEHVSWGWFDYRRKGEALNEGYQSPPVDWGIGSERKRSFFNYLSEITGAAANQREPSGATMETKEPSMKTEGTAPKTMTGTKREFYPAFAHIVYFWLKNPDSPADRAAFETSLKKFMKNSKYAKTGVIGTPPQAVRGVVDGSFTYSLITSFESAEAQVKYQSEEAHLVFIEESESLWSKVIVYDSLGLAE